MNDQEKGIIVDHERRAGVINPAVEIVMMIITEREAGSERDTGTGTGTGTESVTESASIVIVSRWVFLVLLLPACLSFIVIIIPRLLFIQYIPTFYTIQLLVLNLISWTHLR